VDESLGQRIDAKTGTAKSLGRPVTNVVVPVWLAVVLAGFNFTIQFTLSGQSSGREFGCV
jgi:hypothetical protein